MCVLAVAMADDDLRVKMIISITDFITGVASIQGAPNHCPGATDTKPQEPHTLTEGLKLAAKKVYDSSDGAYKNRFRISVRRRKVWVDTYEIFDICKSDYNLPLNIQFTGEEAVDLGGPKREFFSLIFQGLEQQRIVTGSSPCLTFSHDVLAYDRKEYKVCGVLVALSLLNGCSGPHNFCPSLVQCILHEDKQFCKFEIREIPDPDIRRKSEEIEGTSEEKDFKEKVLGLEERFDAGFNKASVSSDDKEKLLQTIAYHYVINTCHDDILQFKEGLSFGGVLDVLQRFPKEAFKELTDGNEAIITPEDFECVFEANLSCHGSNLRMAEEDILYNWENFITNVFRGKVSQTSITIDDDTFQETESTKVITLNDVIMFTTGSYHLPVMGLECKVEIEFEHEPQEGKRVTANTCGPVLTFRVSPRYSCDLETFCKNLAEDIISSPGFGFV